MSPITAAVRSLRVAERTCIDRATGATLHFDGEAATPLDVDATVTLNDRYLRALCQRLEDHLRTAEILEAAAEQQVRELQRKLDQIGRYDPAEPLALAERFVCERRSAWARFTAFVRLALYTHKVLDQGPIASGNDQRTLLAIVPHAPAGDLIVDALNTKHAPLAR